MLRRRRREKVWRRMIMMDGDDYAQALQGVTFSYIGPN